MESVTAFDGTEIVYEQHGDGQPLILLHGGSGDRTHWRPLLAHLRDSFTVITPDRRGRGGSGDGTEYSLDHEVADLAALVEAVDGDPVVFGHSFGGLVTLAGLSELPIERAVLYEPALLVGDHRGGDLADRMQAMIDDGDRRGAMAMFIEEAGGVPDVEVLPWWPEEANVHRVDTVVQENRAIENYRLEDVGEIDVPTLLLTGERGPDHLRDAVFALDEHLTDSHVVELDGLGHMATETAPETVAKRVREFVAPVRTP
jgi:pimeloyl-ACP methyl ester carboxylesterase